MDKDKLTTLLISPDTSIKQAMQKLSETAERILLITDQDNKLLGTITDGDIRRGIIDGLEFGERVETIMRRNFFSIPVTLALSSREEYAKEVMLQYKLEHIPVLDKSGMIVDMILWTDIIGEKQKSVSRQLMPNQVVIMAGGKGTRMDPFTKILPKPLIPVGNKPVIEHIMERFYRNGFHKFIYTLNYKKEYLKLFLKENNYSYMIDWVEEDDFLGTAGGLALLKDKLTDTFFISNCDSILDADFGEILKWHKEQGAAITITGCHSEVKIPYGVLECSNGRLGKILEKPVHDVIINTGIYVMEPHVISYLQGRTVVDMNELIDMVIQKETVSVFPISDGWLDIGQWAEYKKSVEKLGGADIV